MKNLRIIALLVMMAPFAGLLTSEPAKAEDGCPAGMRPNPTPSGTPGANQCIPGYSGSGSSGAPQAPPGRWATRWGAFADDQETGKVGMAGGMTSKGEATKAAIAHCRAKGGLSCQVKFEYQNQCAVAVAGEIGGGIFSRRFVSAMTLDEAADIAVANCSKEGAANCKVYFSVCSLAEWVR